VAKTDPDYCQAVLQLVKDGDVASVGMVSFAEWLESQGFQLGDAASVLPFGPQVGKNYTQVFESGPEY